jgi:hypothetical protein
MPRRGIGRFGSSGRFRWEGGVTLGDASGDTSPRLFRQDRPKKLRGNVFMNKFITLARGAAVGAAVLAATFGLFTSGTSAATVDSSAQHHSIAQHDPAVSKQWHAKVKCDIVRNGHTYTKRTAWGNGPTEQAAVNTAKRNIPVEKGSYKRHCRTLESYRR